MKRWLVRIEALPDGARLYLHGVSTERALRLFPPGATLVVEHLFGDIVAAGSPSRWVSKTDLPSPTTVAEVVSWIAADDALGLVDFDARLEGGVRLSTHDDAEASFTVASLAEASALLETASKSELTDDERAAVVANDGKYVLIEGDGISVFESFKDVLSSGALRGA